MRSTIVWLGWGFQLTGSHIPQGAHFGPKACCTLLFETGGKAQPPLHRCGRCTLPTQIRARGLGQVGNPQTAPRAARASCRTESHARNPASRIRSCVLRVASNPTVSEKTFTRFNSFLIIRASYQPINIPFTGPKIQLGKLMCSTLRRKKLPGLCGGIIL